MFPTPSPSPWIQKTNKVIAIATSGGKQLTFSLGVDEDRFVELMDIAKARIDKALDSKGAPLDELIEGSGKDKIDALYNNFETHTLEKDEGADTVELFQQKMVTSVKAEVVSNIAQQIGENFNPDAGDTIFKVDLYRDLNVSVNGEKLPNGDLAGARDKMVQFVSGDKTMTWAKATQELKVKANIIMACCNQSANAMPLTAFSDALDIVPGNKFTPLAFVENPNKGHQSAYSVTKDDKGNIVINIRQQQHVQMAMTTDHNGILDEQELDETSHVDFEMTITIPKGKLGKADWTKYDHKPVQKAVIDTAFSKEGRAKAASLVPDAYRFKGSVDVKVTAHLDAQGKPTKDLMQNLFPKAKAEPPKVQQLEVDIKPEELFIPQPPPEGPKPVPPAPPLNVPGPVPDIPLKSKSIAEGPKMEGLQMENGLPKITGKAELAAFIRLLTVDAQYGKVSEDAKEKDINGDERTTYTFSGIIFRGDSRGPDDPTMETGFTSQNNLNDPKHKIEAMGLGTESVDDNGNIRRGGWSATGQSGVSCAKTIDGSISYLQATKTYYIIDTSKLPAGEKAWDMEHTVYENHYKERVNGPDGKPFDETAGEVNVSFIPKNAIIGWVQIPQTSNIGNVADNASKLDILKFHLDDCLTFNPDYKA